MYTVYLYLLWYRMSKYTKKKRKSAKKKRKIQL